MLTNFFAGLSSWNKAFETVSRNRLWGYILWPGMISLLVGVVLLVTGWNLKSEIAEWMRTVYPETWWFRDVVDDITAILAFVLASVILILIFKYLVMIIVAPFLGPLSEKVERIATGKPALPFSLKYMVRDIVRALRITLRNVIREIFFTVALLPLNFFPVIGSFAYTACVFLIQSFYAGFGNMDPALERRNMAVSERVRFVRDHRGLAMGNGAAFVLLMFIPIIGWFLAPAYGTVGATLAIVEKLDKSFTTN